MLSDGGSAEEFCCRRRLPFSRIGNHYHWLWFFRHDFKGDSGQRRKNLLRDDCFLIEDHGAEFDRAMLPRHPDLLDALTVAISLDDLGLRQKVIEAVVVRQPEFLLLQVVTDCTDASRHNYCSLIVRDIDRRARGVDAQSALRDQAPEAANELVDLAVGPLVQPLRRRLFDTLLIEFPHQTRHRGWLLTGMSAGEPGGELRQTFHTNESDICRSQEMMHQPGRQLGMTTPHAILIPPEHGLDLDALEKLGMGFVQRRPTLVSCPQVHVEQLAEVVANTGEEAEVLPLRRVRRDFGNVRTGV